MAETLPLVIAITGASGAIYGVRLLEVLLAAGREVHLSVSPSGQAVIQEELGRRVGLERFDVAELLGSPAPRAGQLHYHHYKNLMAPIASGSEGQLFLGFLVEIGFHLPQPLENRVVVLLEVVLEAGGLG